MKTLRNKVQAMNEKRQRNALKCIQVVNKYEKLLGIRVKDTVFRFWDRLRREGISNTNQSQINEGDGSLFSPTFNGLGGNSIVVHDTSMSSISNIHNQSSFLEESSITSVMYSRAKSIYKMKKLYNKYALRFHFDSFVIKAFNQGYKTTLYNPKALKLLRLHALVSKSIHELNKRVFQAFLNNYKQKAS